MMKERNNDRWKNREVGPEGGRVARGDAEGRGNISRNITRRGRGGEGGFYFGLLSLCLGISEYGIQQTTLSVFK